MHVCDKTSVVHEWSVFVVSEGWRLYEYASGDEIDLTRARKRVEDEMRARAGGWLMGVIVLCDLDEDGECTDFGTVATAYRTEDGGRGLVWEWDVDEYGQ